MAEPIPFPGTVAAPPPPAWLTAFIAVVQQVGGIVRLVLILGTLLGVPMLAGFGLAHL